MARVTRIALDLALVSVEKLRPAVGKLWSATKSVVVKTSAKPLVCNVVVDKLEIAVDKFGGLIESAITTLRNKQLPREEKYLEKELDKVRQRMSSGDGRIEHRKRSTSRSLRPILGTAWQYAKVEMVPPTTLGFFNGAPGKKLEATVTKSVDGFISGLDTKIKELDAAELKEKQEKEAAIIAAQEKAKAQAKAKELERKKEEEEKRKVAEKEAKAKAEAKAAEEAKKAEKSKDPPKPAKKAAPKKKPPAKK
ncbi:unnamed protein product [Diatraea saccharalis]|uniref:Uncharacterized protein n=1 Tax=Diatraea saccharalis TaxID=40085 RepID=A0A9N9QTS6_9NEOP|nr:unnamed protein product [Diatraea saccharalis]